MADSHRRTARLSQRSLTSPWLTLPLALLLGACATTVTPSATAPTSAPTASQQASAPAASQQPVAAPEQSELRTLATLQDRLYRVSAPLLVNNTDLCRVSARNLLGFTAKNRFSYSAELANAASSMLGLDDRLQVTGVLPGSGAARAGVKRGDFLLSVEDRPLPQGENAERHAATVLAPLVTRRSNVKMTIQRDGSTMALTVPLTYACAFGIELGNTDNVIAYADGHRVLVSRGMMNTAASDDELAAVLAKEMAHNILSHPSRMKMNATIGGIIDNLIRVHPDMSTMVGLSGVKPMPKEMDAMADRLSLYLLARAGYPVDGALAFWDKMASQYPATNLTAYTALHPATDYRRDAMKKTAADIKRKQALHKPLMP
ncbi:MAG TPA: M48 family metallopeptidase [Noviherbaspirillum sp.]